MGAELYVFQLHSTTSMPWYMQDVVDMGAREAERLRQRLAAALALGQLAPARDAAELLDKPGAWRRVGAAAVAAMDAATAARRASSSSLQLSVSVTLSFTDVCTVCILLVQTALCYRQASSSIRTASGPNDHAVLRKAVKPMWRVATGATARPAMLTWPASWRAWPSARTARCWPGTWSRSPPPTRTGHRCARRSHAHVSTTAVRATPLIRVCTFSMNFA